MRLLPLIYMMLNYKKLREAITVKHTQLLNTNKPIIYQNNTKLDITQNIGKATTTYFLNHSIF